MERRESSRESALYGPEKVFTIGNGLHGPGERRQENRGTPDFVTKGDESTMVPKYSPKWTRNG